MVDTGAGQQDPLDSAGEFNSQVFVVQQQIAKISTMKVVKVKAVDTAAQTVDVQPMVNQIDGDSNATPHGTIYEIPYMIWQYGKNAVLADPVVGDIGIMTCADRDISAVKASKAIAPPGSNRTYDAGDGVYLGGILNAAPEQWVKFTSTGLELNDKNSNKLVSSAAGWTFTGPVTFNQTVDVKGVATLEGSLQLGGNVLSAAGGTYSGTISTSGDVVAGAISLKNHRTSGVTTGGGISGVPVV